MRIMLLQHSVNSPQGLILKHSPPPQTDLTAGLWLSIPAALWPAWQREACFSPQHSNSTMSLLWPLTVTTYYWLTQNNTNSPRLLFCKGCHDDAIDRDLSKGSRYCIFVLLNCSILQRGAVNQELWVWAQGHGESYRTSRLIFQFRSQLGYIYCKSDSSWQLCKVKDSGNKSTAPYTRA